MTIAALDRSEPMPVVYRLLKLLVQWPLFAVFRVRTNGVEHLDPDGGFVLASNHASALDPLLLGATCPRALRFIGRTSLLDRPGVPTLFEATGVIAVDRERGGNESVLQATADEIRQGAAVAIFPEGTRTRDGALGRFRSGAVRLALSAGVPIVPAGLNTYEVLPKGSVMPRLGTPVGLAVGAPIDLPGHEGREENRARVDKVTSELRTRVAELVERARALAGTRTGAR